MNQGQRTANQIWARAHERIKRDKGIVTWRDAERERIRIIARVAGRLLADVRATRVREAIRAGPCRHGTPEEARRLFGKPRDARLLHGVLAPLS